VDAAVCEPGDCALEDTDSGGCLLVAADLDVGDSGVVVDDGVQERGSGPRFPVCTSKQPWSGSLVPQALLSADEPVPATVGDVAELGDVDVDHRPGMRVLVATDRLASDSVDAREPVHSSANQHPMDCRGRNAKTATDLHRPRR
jgi:hypothetical protein